MYKSLVFFSESKNAGVIVGSTSTKIVVFTNEELEFKKTLRHSSEEIEKYERIADQFEFRKKVIENALNEDGVKIAELSSVVGRRGILKPIQGGTYVIYESMIGDLKVGVLGEYTSNLGGLIAKEIEDEVNITSYIVDSVIVDELEDVLRVSRIPEIDRKSIFHALNQKATTRRADKEPGKEYKYCNFIVAHMGGDELLYSVYFKELYCSFCLSVLKCIYGLN